MSSLIHDLFEYKTSLMSTKIYNIIKKVEIIRTIKYKHNLFVRIL
jgi:hypothetical protein